MSLVKIDSGWKKSLEKEFEEQYWKTLTTYIRNQYGNQIIYPSAANIFQAFNLCPFDSVKVVIVGQDPYHGQGQANGLAFSVNDKIALPPSLKNIYQEIRNDLGISPLSSGDLSRWATQGILMLNSVLTVAAGLPASHSGKGWEIFTDAAIRSLNQNRKNIVYMLWGKYAQNKGAVIDPTQNLVLKSAHPSPYSVSMFYGNHHFSKCNEYLKAHGKSEIDWH